MSRLDKIRERVAQIRGGGDNLGPDRGTMDQEKARIERARQEARREAKQEKRRQQVEQARESERERVLNDDGGGVVSSVTSAIQTAAESVDDGDGVGVDDLSEAFGTDFDGDGEPFAQELGLQSAKRARVENQQIRGISRQADRNTGRIGELEDIGVGQPPTTGSRDQTTPETGFGIGGDEFDLEDYGFGDEEDLFGGGGL